MKESLGKGRRNDNYFFVIVCGWKTDNREIKYPLLDFLFVYTRKKIFWFYCGAQIFMRGRIRIRKAFNAKLERKQYVVVVAIILSSVYFRDTLIH